jgi:hypothetical protein
LIIIIQSTSRPSKLFVFFTFFYQTLWNSLFSRSCLMSYPSQTPVTYRIGSWMRSRTDLKALTKRSIPTSTGNRIPAIKYVVGHCALSSIPAYKLKVVSSILMCLYLAEGPCQISGG